MIKEIFIFYTFRVKINSYRNSERPVKGNLVNRQNRRTTLSIQANFYRTAFATGRKQVVAKLTGIINCNLENPVIIPTILVLR